jgi:Protein of unknown function (DUF2764)
MKYYFLVTYLPELHRDDKKIRLSFGDILMEREHIAASDWHQVELLLLSRDICLLGQLLDGKDPEMPHTLYGKAFWQDQIKSPREVPGFLAPLFEGREASAPSPPGGDRLLALFYDYAASRAGAFLAGYFRFEKTLRNVLAAIRARKQGYPPSAHLVGKGDLEEQLGRSRAEDFGLTAELPWIDLLLGSADPLALEGIIERIIWGYLDDQTQPLDFEFDFVLAYLLKLQLLERRLSLSDERGMEIVRQVEES